MEQKVAVVTDAAQGIGLEIGRRLARSHNVKVILTASHATGAEAAARLQDEELDVSFLRLDVTDQTDVRRLTKHLADQFGRLDILVNCATVCVDQGLKVTETDLGLVRQTFETNFYGPLRLCQLLAPLMERNNYGRIVNLSSSMSLLREMEGEGGTLAYRASKSALNVLTRVLAAELSDKEILVNCADAGWTDLQAEVVAADVLVRGVDTVAWLATLPPGGPSGGFFRDRLPVAW